MRSLLQFSPARSSRCVRRISASCQREVGIVGEQRQQQAQPQPQRSCALFSSSSSSPSSSPSCSSWWRRKAPKGTCLPGLGRGRLKNWSFVPADQDFGPLLLQQSCWTAGQKWTTSSMEGQERDTFREWGTMMVETRLHAAAPNSPKLCRGMALEDRGSSGMKSQPKIVLERPITYSHIADHGGYPGSPYSEIANRFSTGGQGKYLGMERWASCDRWHPHLKALKCEKAGAGRRLGERKLVNGSSNSLRRIHHLGKLRSDVANANDNLKREFCFSKKAHCGDISSPPSKVDGVPSESLHSKQWPKMPILALLYGKERRAVAGHDTASSSWQKIFYAAFLASFVGAAAALGSENDTTPRTGGALLSTWSILLETLAEFKEKVGMALKDGMNDLIDSGAAAAVLVRCIISLLLTVSKEPTVGISGWLRPGVAALVADLAAHKSRRKAVVEAGGGWVVDWLLNAVREGGTGACLLTQDEASRALAHLLSDQSTIEDVLSRPHALPYLFQFASTLQAHVDSPELGGEGELRMDSAGSVGRSMLVTAIMDLITSSVDEEDGGEARPNLPNTADPDDIAVALQVIKNEGWLSDSQGQKGGTAAGNDEDSAQGINVLGSTDIGGMPLALPGDNLFATLNVDRWPERLTQRAKQSGRRESCPYIDRGLTAGSSIDVGTKQQRVFTKKITDKNGLWDDLHGTHIAVPLAAWAVATWARASNINRAHIVELDANGDALLAAVLAPEKTVKWHAAVAIRSILSSKCFSHSAEVATRWSSALLHVAAQAGLVKDPSLAHSALSALAVCVTQSTSAHALVLQKGVPVMREIAGGLEATSQVQGALAQMLDVLTAGEDQLPVDESKKWAAILLKWVCSSASDSFTRSCGSKVLARVINNLGLSGVPISQAWLAMLLIELVSEGRLSSTMGKRPSNVTNEAKEREQLQNQAKRAAIHAAEQLAKVVAKEAMYRAGVSGTHGEVAESASELPMLDLLGFDLGSTSPKNASKETSLKVTATEAADAVQKAVKALAELVADDPVQRQRILEAGVLCLLRRFLLFSDYEKWAAYEVSGIVAGDEGNVNAPNRQTVGPEHDVVIRDSVYPRIRKHAARLLSVLTLQSAASDVITRDPALMTWLWDCAYGRSTKDMKTKSYALTSLLNLSSAQSRIETSRLPGTNARAKSGKDFRSEFRPRYEDTIFVMNSGSEVWKSELLNGREDKIGDNVMGVGVLPISRPGQSVGELPTDDDQQSRRQNEPLMDVIFIHGLRGGPFKTWRVADSKTSTTTTLVERIDVEAGRRGTCWPQEWLENDLPGSRLFSVKYKTNLSEWSRATLPLQEVSSMLLDKLLAAGVGERPLVFVTHSLGGLVVKQMLLQAGGDQERQHLVNRTKGIVFYSCPHFGSKLADMPWRIGYVLRPAPSIGDLRSGSPRLEDLNRCLRHLHKERHIDVLSFSETKVTPLVEGYGGWGLRMEVVPIESAYPGFGELVVLQGTDHVNSCKPLDRADPAYTKTLEFLRKVRLDVSLKDPLDGVEFAQIFGGKQ